METGRIERAYVVQGIKVALGATAAIVLANLLRLSYSSTAGIITVLGILGTKKETLVIAGFKLISFLAALLIASVCYGVLGYTIAGFSLYLFVFSVVCYTFGWNYSIAMISVRVSHFLAERSMALPVILNEALLFGIGTVCSILVNLHLRPDDRRMSLLLERIDGKMKRLVLLIGRALDDQGRSDTVARGLDELEQEIQRAGAAAMHDANNRLFKRSYYEIRYLQMRSHQRRILAQIYAAMEKIRYVPQQHGEVRAFFERVAQEYSMDNDVGELLRELDELLARMREQQLPVSREEFEGRALLYYILRRMEDFLRLKREFYDQNHRARR